MTNDEDIEDEVVGRILAHAIKTDLLDCTRCGGPHGQMIFKPLTNPPDAETTHFAICPTTQQPILMWILETSEFRSCEKPQEVYEIPTKVDLK